MSTALMPKYLLTMATSTALLIGPVNIKAVPPFIQFLSLASSVCGFTYSLFLAEPLDDQSWYEEQKKLQEREIILHDLALSEMASKQLLELEYFPPAQLEEEAIAVESKEKNLKESPQQKLLTDALPEHLNLILEAAKKSGGTIKHRDAMRAKGISNKYKAEEIKQFFSELQQRGFGNVTTDGRSYTFTLTRAV